MSTIKIAPSILSANFSYLEKEIKDVESGGADIIHLDIMDGHFVPNITFGIPVVKSIRKITNLPFDAHLMIEEPTKYINHFIDVGVNYLSIHAEAERHLERAISHIKAKGVKAGVALNPATPLSSIRYVLPELDFVLIMTVNPGFGGQKFIPIVLKKIRRLKKIIDKEKYKCSIEVDGGIDNKTSPLVVKAGAEILVAGNYIFSSNNREEMIKSLRNSK